jgi:hypothetical protein
VRRRLSLCSAVAGSLVAIAAFAKAVGSAASARLSRATALEVAKPKPPLAYGRQVTVGRFRCRAGVECTVVAAGRGSAVSREGLRPSGA